MEEFIMLFVFLIGVTLIPLFLAIYFMPTLTLYFHPWICERDVKDFKYSTTMRWYTNWIYRISLYKCKLPGDYFAKVWSIYSIVYSIFILILIVALLYSMNNFICTLGLLLLLFGGDYILRGWVESPLSRMYELRKEMNKLP